MLVPAGVWTHNSWSWVFCLNTGPWPYICFIFYFQFRIQFRRLQSTHRPFRKTFSWTRFGLGSFREGWFNRRVGLPGINHENHWNLFGNRSGEADPRCVQGNFGHGFGHTGKRSAELKYGHGCFNEAFGCLWKQTLLAIRRWQCFFSKFYHTIYIFVFTTKQIHNFWFICQLKSTILIDSENKKLPTLLIWQAKKTSIESFQSIFIKVFVREIEMN